MKALPKRRGGNAGATDKGDMVNQYNSMFEGHDDRRDWRRGHARGVADLLWEYYQPKSMIDLGCGMGFFLAEAAKRGTRVRGVDGPWVNELETEQPLEDYTIHNLEEPFDLGKKRFDMAVSLEVAEHLPKERGEGFVDDLCRLSTKVLFSAAIPGQKGKGHINCQWQGYWAGLFAERGYRCFDPFRRRLVGVEDMAPWFQQNLLLYVKTGAKVPESLAPHEIPHEAASYVMPRWYNQKVDFLRKRMKEFRKRAEEAEAKLAEQ